MSAAATVLPLFLLVPAVAFSAICTVQEWDPAAPVDGAVGAGDCRLTDLIPGRPETNLSKQFTIHVQSKGFYTIDLASTEFDTILLLTDARFQPLALNDDTARNDSRLTAHLTPETYYVFVIAGRGGGAFNLRSSFDERSPCAIREIDGAEFSVTVTSQLGSSSCRLLDAVAPLGSTRATEIFRFQVREPRVLNAVMQSRAIDPLLALVDSVTGRVVAVDDDGLDGFNALLLRNLEPGEYFLVATLAQGTAGAYTMQATLNPPRGCETRDLRAGDSASGQLLEADCRLLDALPGDDTENRVDVYRVQITDPGVLTLDVNSGNFPPAVFLLSSDNKLLDSAASARTNQSARVAISLKPGEYRIAASHAQLQTGAYQLRTTFEPLRVCPPEALAPDSTATGFIAASDCRFQDLIVPSNDFTNVKPYTLTLEKRSVVIVDMTSPQMDSFLFALDSSNRVLAQDDNSGGGRNARVTMQLNPGAYTLFANTATVQSGPFDIKASLAEPRGCPVNELAFSEPAQGQLTDQDCAIRDVIAEDGRAIPSRFHRLALTEPGTISLDLYSASFLPALILVDTDGRRIVGDEPAPQTSLGAAHIRRTLPAGIYGVVVTATGGRAGDYTLRASFRK